MSNQIMQWYEHYASQLWSDDLRGVSTVRRWIIVPVRMLVVLTRQLVKGQLNLRAMSLVYTTLLSIVPLLAVSFSVLDSWPKQVTTSIWHAIMIDATNFIVCLRD